MLTNSAEGKPRHSCTTPGTHVVIETPRVRIDYKGGRGQHRYYFCLARTGVRRLLANDTLFGQVRSIRVAVPYAAWVEEDCEQGACVDRVAVRNMTRPLKTGTGTSAGGHVAVLAATRNGHVLWSVRTKDASGGNSAAVLKFDGRDT